MTPTPTITLMAYRQPTVNGELMEVVIRTAAGPILLAGSRDFFRRLAADVSSLIGTPALPYAPPARGEGAGRPRGTGQCLTPDARAAILVQIRAVQAGTLTRKQAAAALGITLPAFTGWLRQAAKLTSE
jgi:hypothetical protein